MSSKYRISKATTVFILIVLLLMAINIFTDYHPIYEFVKYLVGLHLYAFIPLAILLPVLFVQLDIWRQRKIEKEKLELFSTTIHTMQDFTNNLLNRMQLVIMDLEEADVKTEIIDELEKISKEAKKLTSYLSQINPLEHNVRNLADNIKVFSLFVNEKVDEARSS